MTDEIELYCWVIGDDPDKIFPVQIEKSKTVGNLRDAIKTKNEPQFRDIAANTLTLRKIYVAEGDLDAQLEQIDLDYLKILDKLRPTHPLSRVFSDSLIEGHLLVIIVQPPLVGECW
jgi:hypothetical protein